MNNNINSENYKKNFLNNLGLETAIYKYISVDHVAEMRKSGCLRFCLVNSWEDVYENHFLKQTFITPEGESVDAKKISGMIYGQCWTEKEESDAMWRIYSENKRAIKVKTTAEKLMDVLYVDESCQENTYIGRVDYVPQRYIENRLGGLSQYKIPISSFNGNQGIYNFIKESLITKRMEFVHEEEVRIFKMFPPGAMDHGYIDMPFDMDSFFEEFIMDPRVSAEEEDEIRIILMNSEINPAKIAKSHLYDLNRYTLII